MTIPESVSPPPTLNQTSPTHNYTKRTRGKDTTMSSRPSSSAMGNPLQTPGPVVGQKLPLSRPEGKYLDIFIGGKESGQPRTTAWSGNQGQHTESLIRNREAVHIHAFWKKKLDFLLIKQEITQNVKFVTLIKVTHL